MRTWCVCVWKMARPHYVNTPTPSYLLLLYIRQFINVYNTHIFRMLQQTKSKILAFPKIIQWETEWRRTADAVYLCIYLSIYGVDIFSIFFACAASGKHPASIPSTPPPPSHFTENNLYYNFGWIFIKVQYIEYGHNRKEEEETK